MKFEKDEKILSKWVGQALRKAQKHGFARRVNLEKIIEIYMTNEFAFNTLEDERLCVVNWIYKDLMVYEEICRYADNNRLSHVSLRNVCKFAMI